MNIVIHHNPKCSTSRNVLRVIEAAGNTPTIIEYLKTGWTRPQLLGLFAAANLRPKDALRANRSPAKDLGLADPDISDEALIDAMIAHPEIVERPIVCSPRGVRLCRPIETVFELLEQLPPAPFYKENGELLIGADGPRA